MIRKGRFALSNGREYGLISYQRQNYLKSEDPYDLEHGFIRMNISENLFMKRVSVSELDDAYEIFPYAMVGSYRFSVEGYDEKTGAVSLVTNNQFVKGKINVRPYGQDEYILEIPYDDLQIIEDRISILGFERSYFEQI